MTDSLNSLHSESNIRHLNDFISAIVFSLGFLRLNCIYFDQYILFHTLCIYEENFSEAHFLFMGSIIFWTILIFLSRQECYNFHSLSRKHRLWLNKPDSWYVRTYIALISVPSTMHSDPKSVFQIRNSGWKRFSKSMSLVGTWTVSIGLSKDPG